MSHDELSVGWNKSGRGKHLWKMLVLVWQRHLGPYEFGGPVDCQTTVVVWLLPHKWSDCPITSRAFGLPWDRCCSQGSTVPGGVAAALRQQYAWQGHCDPPSILRVSSPPRISWRWARHRLWRRGNKGGPLSPLGQGVHAGGHMVCLTVCMHAQILYGMNLTVHAVQELALAFPLWCPFL